MNQNMYYRMKWLYLFTDGLRSNYRYIHNEIIINRLVINADSDKKKKEKERE